MLITPSHKESGGFTLIEILLALTIMGLMGGLMLVNLGGLTRPERIRSAARKLAGMSDFIRSRSTDSKVPSYLEIDFDHSRFRWRSDPVTDPFGRPRDLDDGHVMTEEELVEWRDGFEWEDLPTGVFFTDLWINNRQSFKEGVVPVTYFADGNLSSYILWLNAPGEGDDLDLWFSVVVNGLTGKSEVIEGQATFGEARESDFTEVMGAARDGESRR